MSLFNGFNGIARRFDPWQELSQLQQEMSRLASRVRDRVVEFPAVNIYSGSDSLVVTAEIPGIDPEKLDIVVVGDSLTIRGDVAVGEAHPNETYHRQERPRGPFARTVQLPWEVDPGKTEAHYEKGVLRVHLARPEQQKPRKIVVKPA